jgi:restriction system protein
MKKDAPKREVPKFDELMNPTLQALKRLGGSASIDELVPEIVKFLGLPQEVAEVPHGTTGRTELEYRAAWARTYLRNAAYVENSERGVWSPTSRAMGSGF